MLKESTDRAFHYRVKVRTFWFMKTNDFVCSFAQFDYVCNHLKEIIFFDF